MSNVPARGSPLEQGAATMWNIEIGEPVPETWEPLSSVLANADVETSWQHGVGCNDRSSIGECA